MSEIAIPPRGISPSSWILREVPSRVESSEALVAANQQRLREHSTTNMQTQPTSTTRGLAYLTKEESEDAAALNLMLLDLVCTAHPLNFNQVENHLTVPGVTNCTALQPLREYRNLLDELIVPVEVPELPSSNNRGALLNSEQSAQQVESTISVLTSDVGGHLRMDREPRAAAANAIESLNTIAERDAAALSQLLEVFNLNPNDLEGNNVGKVATVITADVGKHPIALESAIEQVGSVTPSIENSAFNGELEDLLNSSIKSTERRLGGAKPGVSSMSWASEERLDAAEYDALRPHMALQFPFELDDFQRQAVMRLERRECVFVSAHTSAGKTVVAEYAIALAQKHMTRAVYTSPIKALSNQKFRDLRQRFGDSAVGLITGDTSNNPGAGCLVMTTEILRSMLYRGSDAVRDIEFVIFDEVHYVNDAERGVVWEEVIILLPPRVHMVFLSATTPNTLEFSDWIGRTKRRKVYVTGTAKRPVPLQHFLFHRDEVQPLTSAGGPFRVGSVGEFAARLKERDMPKAKSAENAKMANDRAGEKLALASQRAGRTVTAHADKPAAKVTGTPKGVIGTAMGSKPQWVSLVNLLKAGGREEAGGLTAVDFGVGFSGRVLSSAARKERDERTVPYERLPSEMRAAMTKREYERDAAQVRGSDEEAEGSKEGLLPAIIFCFSKKKCEEIADYLSGLSLLTAREKAEVKAVVLSATARLTVLDARLPQVLRIEEMLSRGVAVHHGGLLPLLKEVVELLFAKSVVKVLIATETFAMGVNMPARCVVFNGFRKHDGKGFRDLQPGEYTQMAGRAGRRGKDKLGIVIIAAWNDLPSEPILMQLLAGRSTALNSKFRLTYSMVMNLMRAGDIRVEDMIRRSFSEFHAQRILTSNDIGSRLTLWRRAATMVAQVLASEDCGHGHCPIVQCVEALTRCKQALQKLLRGLSGSVGAAVCPGRLGMLITEAIEYPQLHFCPCPCAVLTEPTAVFSVPSTGFSASSTMDDKTYDSLRVLLLVLLPDGAEPLTIATPTAAVVKSTNSFAGVVLKRKDDFEENMRPVGKGKGSAATASAAAPVVWATQSSTAGKHAFVVAQFPLSDLAALVVSKVSLPASTDTTELTGVLSELKQAWSTNVGTLEPLNVAKELRLRVDLDTADTQRELAAAARAYIASPCQQCPRFLSRLKLASQLHMLKTKTSFWESQLSSVGLQLFPDFQQRLLLLRRLGYLEPIAGSEEGAVVALKGRVACEMSTCDELLAAEMIFEDVLGPLNPPEAAALLSALVFQEKSSEDPELTTRLEEARMHVRRIDRALETLSESLGIRGTVADEQEGRPRLNFGLAAAVYQWARGSSFADVALMTDIQEGGIVRCITRLDELCRDIRNAARVVGNPSLYRKMDAASQCIKRDIVFAASLYFS